MKVHPTAAAAGVRLFAHERLGSTNAEALELARRGEAGMLWVTAAAQMHGRGRRGRQWVSEPGNLYATLLLTEPGPPEHWGELSFVAALGLYDAVVDVAPALRPGLSIKWPNDLLFGGAKLAGILIEASGAAVAIGIGVNCVNHPAQTEFPATDLTAAGAAVSAEDLFMALSLKLLGRLAQWHGGEGFATIRTDWLARAAGIGEAIQVRLNDRTLVGRFDAIDEAGRLVLTLPDGKQEVIAAGDVIELARGAPPKQGQT